MSSETQNIANLENVVESEERNRNNVEVIPNPPRVLRPTPPSQPQQLEPHRAI